MKAPKMGNDKNTHKPAALILLVTGALLVAIAGIAVEMTAARSDSVDQDKQDVLNRLAATRAAAIDFATEHPDQVPTGHPTIYPTIQPTSWSVGIVNVGGGPFSGGDFGAANHWSWDLDGNHEVVYAGADGPESRNPSRGALLVLVETMSLQGIPALSGGYLAPSGVGPLIITSYQGTVLTLQAATGETFYFDAETRAFTDANGDPVPTDTPTPMPEPPPTAAPTTPATAQPTLAATVAVGG
jgi:hypothetical protein